MVTDEIAAVLPPLYAGWIGTLLEGTIPPETHATCDDCAMCAPEGAQPEPGAIYFSPRIKCCTYQPRLPNYLVGRALEDEDFAFSAGRATLESRIERGVAVTPLGVDCPPAFHLLYQGAENFFGRAESMRCPHYLEAGGGRCGIWPHRNSVCATWFCKHERGAIGRAFWLRVRDLLMSVESNLAVWCVLESGLDAQTLASLFPEQPRPGVKPSLTGEDMDGRPVAARARKVWGRWLGREREFYRECARRAGSLGWEEVQRIGGAEMSARACLTRLAYAELIREETADRLRAGIFQIVSTTRQGVHVVSYAGSDPLELDPEILEILPYFDGRTTAEALETIRRELGLEVEEDLVRKLADFQILVSADSNPP